MKTFRFVVAVLFSCVLLAISSCSKNGEPISDPSSKEGNLIGTWKLVDCPTLDLFAEVGWASEDAILYLQFKSNGRYTALSIQNDEVDNITTGKWNREDDGVKLIADGYSYGYTYKIANLNSSKLVLEALTLQAEFKKVSDSEIEEYLDSDIDNDEEDGYCSVCDCEIVGRCTINGDSYHSGYGSYDSSELEILRLHKNKGAEEEYGEISINLPSYISIDDIKQGQKLDFYKGNDNVCFDFYTPHYYDYYVSGSITCIKKEGTDITLSFNNIVLKNTKDNSRVTITGVFQCKRYDEPKPEPDPEPQPTTSEYIFQNNIAINADLTKYVDITLELTDVYGKITTTDITELGTTNYSYTNPYTGETKWYTMYVFKNTDTHKSVPAQTTLRLNFTAKVTAPAEKIDQVILYDFKVKGTSAIEINQEQFFATNLTLDEAKFKSFVESLNRLHGSIVMKVSTDGRPSIE